MTATWKKKGWVFRRWDLVERTGRVIAEVHWNGNWRATIARPRYDHAEFETPEQAIAWVNAELGKPA